MNSFTDYVSSDRQGAFNALRPTTNPRQVFVYVEDTNDVAFWHGILCPYEKKAFIQFKISPYSDDNATTGKGTLQKKFSQTGENLIICLDSDYDYLLSENSEKSKEIKRNKYIFQTYAYAIENLKCYAKSLNPLCVKATNSTDDTVDLSKFLEEYSRIIYPLFICNLYYEFKNKTDEFSRDDFSKTVVLGNLTSNNYETSLKKLKESTSKKIEEFNSDIDIAEFSKQFSELNNTNTYLFISGHTLHPTILSLMKDICKKLECNSIEEVKKIAQPHNISERIKHYRNSTHSIETLLAINENFKDCFLFKKIEDDIQAYLEILKPSETHV